MEASLAKKDMELLIKTLLYLHIGAGMCALVVAPIAMATKKGGKQHKSWGKAYFWSMTIAIVTALIISIYKFIPFLLMVAVFSYYSVIQGYRALYHKSLYQGKGVEALDWVALIINGLFNITFVLWGIWQLSSGQWGFFAYLGIAFGLGGLAISRATYKRFTSLPTDKNNWLFIHINGMVRGYIATLTAFSVTTLTFLPGVIAWIWPVLLGVPIIAYWIRRYRKLLSSGKNIKEVVILE